MNIFKPAHLTVTDVSFSFYKTSDIKKISVKKISNPILFDVLNRPTEGGLYDPSLGPMERSAKCVTCGSPGYDCLGHAGHIELCVPVFNPMTFSSMVSVLKGMCFNCHQFLHSKVDILILTAKFVLLDEGLYLECLEVDQVASGVSADFQVHALMSNQADGAAAKRETNTFKSTHFSRLSTTLSAFVKKCIKGKAERGAIHGSNSAIHQKRGELVRDFFTTLLPSKRCQKCGFMNRTVFVEEGTRVILRGTQRGKATGSEDSAQKLLTPLRVKQHFEKLWELERGILDRLFGTANERLSCSSMFFLEAIAVPPSRFRPANTVMEQTFEHPQNAYLTEILKADARLCQLIANSKGASTEYLSSASNDIVSCWTELQKQTLYLFDSSRNLSGAIGKEPPAGIKQLLEKKEGLFRKHMMGKRVNYAARTVISPDPHLDTNEIGIPLIFARKLTYPEPVTRFNFAVLRECVINGCESYPGASHIQREDGSLVSLKLLPMEERTALANQLLTPSAGSEEGVGKKVFRHLKDGDILLLNRQPTLHKPSIMAHRCHVLPGEKVLRMHYANCDTYNADFDGDEMNVHFPQNELARAEGYEIVATDHQYLVPTDGEPIRGLIQDHIGISVWLTKRDTFLTRDEYQQLIFGSFPSDRRITILPPCLLHPKPLWTGKQVISTLLLNLIESDRVSLNLTSACKIPARMWPSAEEAEIRIVDGIFVTGILDKSQLGATAFGLTHSIQELYGGVVCNAFISAMGRLLTKYLQMVGFTCRLDDLMLTDRANFERKSLIDQSMNLGTEVYAKFTKTPLDTFRSQSLVRNTLLERILRSEEAMHNLDGAMKGAMNKLTSDIIRICLPDGQLIAFPHNHMSLMTVSGAKGSNVNFSQISGLLGQQELEGRRVPTMVSGKTLPSFLPFDTRACAGGYISGRFLTGIRPEEYYFHCMAGREGLIDTAVKTSRSGYLQRCLIKHLEGLRVHYDHTVRDSDRSVVQFFYGEDGLDVLKQKYMRKMDFVAKNFDTYISKYQPSKVLDRVDNEAAVSEIEKGTISNVTVMSKFEPSRHLGSVSEAFQQALEEYIATAGKSTLSGGIKNNGQRGVTPVKFRALMWLKFMQALAEPGDAVGVLAAQSIGEPSTQMTLNTFHLAGFGAKNVTLGIPRLREIIMVASKNIMTPSMTLPLIDHNVSEHKMTLIANAISRVTLKTILHDVVVKEVITSRDRNGVKTRDYTVQLNLLPINECEKTFNISAKDLKVMLELRLLKILISAVVRVIKKQSADVNESDVIGASSIAKVRAIMADSDEENPQESTANASELERRQELYESSSSSEDEDAPKIASSNDEAEDSDTEVANLALTAKKLPAKSSAPGLYVHHFLRSYEYSPSNSSNCISIVLTFPSTLPKIQMLELVEAIAEKIVIHEISGIKKCYPQDGDLARQQKALLTEGVNLSGIRDLYDTIDLENIYSNDIHAILNAYGVEAAHATITKEIAAVFGVYGISIDRRHLSLIADTMTFGGGFRPFNRRGMQSIDSPFQAMSFETTVNFLKSATIFGDVDYLQSPSSQLVAGIPSEVGTGSLALVLPISITSQ